MNKSFLGLLFCLLISFLVYSNIFQNSFIADDHNFILDWPLIRDLKNFPQFFGPQNQPPGEEGVYSPLKTVFHAINYHFFGRNPFGYHVVAVFVHLMSVFFIYRISQFITGNHIIAVLTASLFGVHPIHVEAITSMTGFVDTSGIMFLFISFYFYMQVDTEGKRQRYPLALVFAELAIFMHELSISLPVLFLLYDFCYRYKGREDLRAIAQRVAPFFLILCVYVLLKFFVLGDITRGGYLADSFYLTMLVMLKVVAKYILLLIFPITLAANQKISNGIFAVDVEDFDHTAILAQSIFDKEVLLSMMLIGLFVWLAIKYWRKNPLISFSIGWFFVSLLPVSNIIPTSSYFAERYLYPGSFAYCLLLAYALVHVKTRWVGVGLGVIIFAFYSTRTLMRNTDWSNALTFYQAEVRANPESAMMQHDLGVIYLRYEQPFEAIKHFEESLNIRKDDPNTKLALAEAYMMLNEPFRAIEYLQDAISQNPRFAKAHYNLAVVYASLGQDRKARQHFNQSMTLYGQQDTTVNVEAARTAFEMYLKR